MANSNRKKARKLQTAKKTKAAEKEKTVKKVKPAEEKPIKYTVTAEQQADGTFEFHGGKGGFNIIKQKNKALLLRRTLTICIRWPEVKMYWNCMEAYTATIVRNAERHTALITLRILMEYRIVNAAESLNLM